MKRLVGLLCALGLGVAGSLVALPAQAGSYINVKNSVNSDAIIMVYRVNSSGGQFDRSYLGKGENAVKYNGDGSVRIDVDPNNNSIDSYQYYYGGSWKSCHDGSDNPASNPTNDYYDVTLRNFYTTNCDGRN